MERIFEHLGKRRIEAHEMWIQSTTAVISWLHRLRNVQTNRRKGRVRKDPKKKDELALTLSEWRAMEATIDGKSEGKTKRFRFNIRLKGRKIRRNKQAEKDGLFRRQAEQLTQ